MAVQVALEQKILMLHASKLLAYQAHATTESIFTHKMLIGRMRHDYSLAFKDNLESQRNLHLFMCKGLIA